jgi:hypothetical protein
MNGAPPSDPSIVGDLRLDDEFMHPVTDDLSFSESMMFNFFDDTRRLGGFVRIGNRVNSGHAEVTFCVFLPGGHLLMQWAKPEIADNVGFDSAGMHFQVHDPARRLEVVYQGSAVRMTDPLEMRDPGRALRGNPTVPVSMRLAVEHTGPMIGSASGDRQGAVIFLDGVGHYQQAIALCGTLQAGDECWQFSGFGARDHSWGRRVWSSIFRDRSIWITFGRDLAFICCKTWLDPNAPPDVMGCVIEGTSVTPFRRIDLETMFRPDSHDHQSLSVTLEDVKGRRYVLHGQVLAYVPLRHRSPDHETVFLGQAMTQFKLDGRTALGLSEYFDAASACPSLIAASQRAMAVHE